MNRLGLTRVQAVLLLFAGVVIGAVSVGAVWSSYRGPEVRITARLLEDGRIEMGMQERLHDGWQQRLLPERRYFPADATPGSWLTSSSIVIGDNHPIVPHGLPIEAPDTNPEHGPSYFAYDTGNEDVGFRTALIFTGIAQDLDWNRVILAFFCDSAWHPEHVWVMVRVASTIYPFAELNTYFEGKLRFAKLSPGSPHVSAHLDGTPSLRWEYAVHEHQMEIYPGDVFLDAAQRSRTVELEIPTQDGIIKAIVDLRGGWNTPIQLNLEHCGLY